MVRQRARDEDIQKNLAFYSAQMPQKKK